MSLEPSEKYESFNDFRQFVEGVVDQRVVARIERLEENHSLLDAKMDANTRITLATQRTAEATEKGVQEIKELVRLSKIMGALTSWLMPIIAAIATTYAALKGWKSK